MIRHSDDLFQLIRSLSKSEKRHFKLSVSPYGGEKKYLLLFDAIDAQKDYDETELRERFRDEKFIRQFNVAKRFGRETVVVMDENLDAGPHAIVLRTDGLAKGVYRLCLDLNGRPARELPVVITQ